MVANGGFMTNIVAKKPNECAKSDLKDFENLVIKGDEVAAEGLRDRMVNAEWLIFLFEDDGILAGIAALKRPTTHYKQSVFSKAESKEDPKEFPFEAGWIYVKEQFRRRHYSRDLLWKTVELAGDKLLFATTRENNEPMRRTNNHCGFQQSGQPYKSEKGNYNLILYTKRSSATNAA
jgi:hypothetical protein